MKKKIKYFTVLVIVLNSQVGLGLVHLIDYYTELYSKIQKSIIYSMEK